MPKQSKAGYRSGGGDAKRARIRTNTAGILHREEEYSSDPAGIAAQLLAGAKSLDISEPEPYQLRKQKVAPVIGPYKAQIEQLLAEN